MNVGSLLPRHARYRGDHTALVVGDRRMSFRELNRYVNVSLNDEDVRVLDGLGTGVGESDELVILPAMAGGSLPA